MNDIEIAIKRLGALVHAGNAGAILTDGYLDRDDRLGPDEIVFTPFGHGADTDDEKERLLSTIWCGERAYWLIVARATKKVQRTKGEPIPDGPVHSWLNVAAVLGTPERTLRRWREIAKDTTKPSFPNHAAVWEWRDTLGPAAAVTGEAPKKKATPTKKRQGKSAGEAVDWSDLDI